MSTTTEPAAGDATRDATVDTGALAFLRFFVASLKKAVLIMVRYPVNTLSQFGTMFLFFLAIFYGGRAVAPAAITDTLSGIIVGYMLWTLCIACYGGLSWGITREAQWGTLEQLFMSPFGFGPVMAVRTVVDVLTAFFMSSVTLLFMMLVTGQWLTLDPLTVIPLAALALAPAIGIGFVFGGLAIRYKRIENAFNLVQFVFIGLIAAPVDQYPLLKWLPLAQGSQLLQTAMADGVPLWTLPTDELAVLVVTAVVYLGAGYAVFYYCQRWARREGVMGHY